MSQPQWRLATPDDRRLFESFTCTRPVPKSAFGRKKPPPHPKPWEKDVEKWYHEVAYKRASVKQADDTRIWVAVADGEIAAASAHSLPGEDHEQWLRARLGGFKGPIRLLLTVAVSTTWRGQGGRLADEACEQALADAVDRSGGHATLVVCRIDMRNRASEAMAQRHYFDPLSDGPDEFDPDMRQWAVMAEADDS
ncbi:hypothetical protein AB0E21_19405 [Streptomyces sp. NPDC047967]|uniref:hypothetical protein n=1 Tax=Streptomyces sp. NPDC047967 TaxID=3154924 RepID=UPI0033F05F14